MTEESRKGPPDAGARLYGGRSWPWVILLLAASVLVYVPTLDYPFQYDDYAALLNNPGLRVDGWGVGALKESTSNAPRLERRPVAQIGFLLSYRAFGFDPAGWRAVNIALHAGNVLLLFLIGRLLLPLMVSDARAARWAPLLGASLWALHPVHTQAVTYVVQRVTSQMTFFFLSAVLFYLVARAERRPARRWAALTGMCASFILALGSKENAAVFPMAIVLLEAAIRGGWGALVRDRKVFVALIAGLAAYCVIVVFLFTGGTAGLEGYATREFTVGQRLLSEARVMVLYFSLLLLPLPWRLTIDRDVAVSTGLLNPWTTLPSVALVLALVSFSIAFFSRWKAFSLSVLWFFLCISIESTVYPLDLYYEHRLYLPTTMPALMCGYLAAVLICRASSGRPAERNHDSMVPAE